MGEDEGYDSHNTKNNQHHSIVDSPIEEHDGLVAEEVEKEPPDEDDQEDHHGNWVPQEAEK